MPHIEEIVLNKGTVGEQLTNLMHQPPQSQEKRGLVTLHTASCSCGMQKKNMDNRKNCIASYMHAHHK